MSEGSITRRGFREEIVKDGLTLWLDAGLPESYPGSGTTWFDLSGSGLHATGTSAITGGALRGDQAYNTASTSILNTDAHTVALMLQISGVNGSWSKILGYEPSGSDRSPGVWRRPHTRRLHWRYDPGNTSADFTIDSIGDDVGTEFVPLTWYYVCTTKNGADTRSYTNSVYLGQRNTANPKSAGNAAVRLYPGYGQNTSRMAMVHIYNRPLTHDEIRQNFEAVRGRFGI